jgi:diketogulonate reductase-like aldo/keto reductase
MRYETISNLKIPKIGFGTWTIGGRSAPDTTIEKRSLAAMHSALELGYTHFDTAEYYAGGHTEELLGRAVRDHNVPRETLFITTKVSPEHLNYDEVLSCCQNSLLRLGMDFIDLYLIHWPMNGMNLKATFQAFNKLVREGQVRHLGVSNFNLGLLKQAAALSETPLLTDQVPYCIFERTYVDNGVFEYCQNNDILLTAYSPIKPGNMKTSETMIELVSSRGITPQQAALAWLTTQPRVITIPMSFNPQHQAENLEAADIILNESEMDGLNQISKI